MTMSEVSARVANILSALADLDRTRGAIAARRRRKKGRVRRAIGLQKREIRNAVRVVGAGSTRRQAVA